MSNTPQNEIRVSDLEKLSAMSEIFLQLTDEDLDYQQICDDMLEISGAKYTIFNLYGLDGLNYSTVAISGDQNMIKRASTMLGFNFVGQKRQQNSMITDKIKDMNITTFSSLSEMAGNSVPKAILRTIEKAFNIGTCYFVKISKNDVLIGDFQLIMNKNQPFFREAVVEIYSRQLGLFLIQKRAEEKVNQEILFKEALFEALPGYLYVYDEAGRLLRWNKKHEDMTGYNAEELSQMTLDKWFEGEDFIKVTHAVDQVFKTGRGEVEADLLIKGGDKLRILSNGIRLTLDDKNYLIGVGIDITQRKLDEEALRKSRDYLENLLTNANSPIIVWDNELKITIFNRAFEELSGRSFQEVSGKRVDLLFPKTHKKTFLELVKKTNFGDRWETVEIEIENKNGTIRTLLWNSAILYSPDGEKIEATIAQGQDITARKKAENKIAFLSYHDHLTGLYNRRFYEEELRRLDTKRNLPIVLIMVDVNGLKLTNDAFGHKFGDQLLVKIAELLKNECRADEIVARIGGDEFVLLLPKTTAEEAKKLINRISTTIEKERVGNIVLSISMGFAVKESIADQMDEVFKRAEDDMYRHKLSESSSMRSKTIDLIMSSLFEKNDRESHHSKRVSEICEAIETKMNFDKFEINQIKTAGLMHDIGKIGIGDHILNKKGKLTSEEWQEIKRHPEVGYRILSSSNEFSEIADYVLEHQERWDGKGYPKGLKGEEIAVEARIIAIADAYDAMTSNRSYRHKLSEQEALLEIEQCAGHQFDPEIAKVFIEKVIIK